MTANNKQIAGDHYKKYGDLQPWDVVIKWNLGYLEGTALKYIARWRDKGGIDDIKKAIHFLEKLVEIHSPKPDPRVSPLDIALDLARERAKPMDIYPSERLYDSTPAPKHTWYSDNTAGGAPLDQWARVVASQKALDDYHARDV